MMCLAYCVSKLGVISSFNMAVYTVISVFYVTDQVLLMERGAHRLRFVQKRADF